MAVNNIPDAALKKIRRLGKMLNALALVSPSLAGRVAFRVFCTPRALPVREKDADFLTSARHERFKMEGLTLRSYHWDHADSEAPRILFLHGWESNSARWHKYIREALSKGYAVDAFDAPASGHSEGKLLNALLYSRALRKYLSINPKPYAIVGHSLGSAAAVFGLTLFPIERPQKVVLLASFADSSRVIYDFANLIGAKELVVKAIFRHIEKRSGMSIDEFSVQQKVRLLQDVTGFVLHDAADEVAPVTEGRDIAASWTCQYLETQGLGHKMQDKQVVRAVLDFLKI